MPSERRSSGPASWANNSASDGWGRRERHSHNAAGANAAGTQCLGGSARCRAGGIDVIEQQDRSGGRMPVPAYPQGE